MRGLKNHLSEKHQGLPGLDPSVKEAVGTCRLKLANDKECGKKFSTHQINRHIKRSHPEVVLPNDSTKKIRGFMKDGDSVVAIFLRPDEMDPECEFSVEVCYENEDDDDDLPFHGFQQSEDGSSFLPIHSEPTEKPADDFDVASGSWTLV